MSNFVPDRLNRFHGEDNEGIQRFQIEDRPPLFILLLSKEQVGIKHWIAPLSRKLNNHILYQSTPVN